VQCSLNTVQVERQRQLDEACEAAGHIRCRYDGARACHPRQIATLRWLDVVRSALGHEGILNALTSMSAFSLLADVFANS
jgi:hypothetical protein